MTQDDLFAAVLLAIGKCPSLEWDLSCDHHYAEFCKFISEYMASVGLQGLQIDNASAYSFYSQYVQFAGIKR